MSKFKTLWCSNFVHSGMITIQEIRLLKPSLINGYHASTISRSADRWRFRDFHNLSSFLVTSNVTATFSLTCFDEICRHCSTFFTALLLLLLVRSWQTKTEFQRVKLLSLFSGKINNNIFSQCFQKGVCITKSHSFGKNGWNWSLFVSKEKNNKCIRLIHQFFMLVFRFFNASTFC